MTEATVKVKVKAHDGRTVYAVIDADLAPMFAAQTWRLSKPGYVYWRSTLADGKRVEYRLHRVIAGLLTGDPREVDHVNGDPLDNRRANLRICTRAENAQNRRVRGVGFTSKHRGVSYNRHSDRWDASLTVGGKVVFREYYRTEQEAADAVAAARAKHAPFSTEAWEAA